MFNATNNTIYPPNVIENTPQGQRSMDIYSRLLEDRIVFLNGEVSAASANLIIAQLLYLDSKDPDKEIAFYINSPGGSVVDGLAIYDTMNYIKSDVCTICVGLAASMGAFLLAGGAKGKRFSLPNSEILIHQPLMNMSGTMQASDVFIRADNLKKTKDKLNGLMAEFTGKSVEEVERDTDRDNIMSAEEALSYGIIDKIYYKR